MSEQNLEKFINRFSTCPVCHKPNHVDSLKDLYYSNDPIKKVIKNQLGSEKLDRLYDLQIGIACCSCYSRIFCDKKVPLILNSSFKLKIIMVCANSSRKTALVQNFVRNRFAANYKLTVGVDILTRDVEYSPNLIATLSIWDVGNQQRFEFIRSTFYKGAAGAVLVFDLTIEQTFAEMIKRLTEIRHFAGYKIPFVFIGTNADLIENIGDGIDKNEAREWVEREGGIYADNSIEIGLNTEEALRELTRRIVSSRTNLND